MIVMNDARQRRLFVLALEQHRARTPNGRTPSARASTVEPDGTVVLRDHDAYQIARFTPAELATP